ncbi:hypothetical protein SAY87_012634 [Trapa incisa]|uniref:Uncharacterized protein n=1 Tax=Trapa incisa TaxID=236973 RepID=A0AAN7H1C7_9MYRT|nr:hypothetical protein SAY87_012634 [Trapa incisa]
MATNMKSHLLLSFLSLQLSLHVLLLHAQQEFLINRQFAFHNSDNITPGFACNRSDQPTCQSYLAFQSNVPYTSIATIGYLLSDAPLMATLSSTTDDLGVVYGLLSSAHNRLSWSVPGIPEAVII